MTSITALILGATNFASASYNPVSRDLCTLMVKPFDSTKNAITGSSGNQYINYLNNECEEHVTYPNVYSPQPPLKSDNPLKYNAEGKHLPLTRHDHIYYNDSLHDNYYYKSFVDRFEITLESDGYNSIDLDEIECQTPYPAGFNPSNLAPLLDCSGTVSNLWGGTTITKQYIGNNIRVTWDFGQTNQNGKYIGRPPVWGNNGPNFPEGNFADDDDRSLEFYITLPSEDNDEIWSATTTSKVLVADLSIKKSNFNTNSTLGCSENNVNSPNSGWCYLTPNPGFQTETVFTSSNKTFYWLPIGSVTTVWREPELNICTNLSASMLNETCTAGGETGPVDPRAHLETEIP